MHMNIAMKIQINLTPEIQKAEPKDYSYQTFPEGYALYCERLNCILMVDDNREGWIGFGLDDDSIAFIEDTAPIEGVKFEPTVTIWGI